MAPNCGLSARLVERFRRTPIHAVLRELGQAARDQELLTAAEFQKLVAYLLELADGRDRREPWAQKPGIARPVPRLRVAMDGCFGTYGDLQWFRLNKIANHSGHPLVGLFPRMAASVARIAPEDFGPLVAALVADSPDTEVLQLLQTTGGKVPGAGLELFSRMAYAVRPDLYFVIPRQWGDASGCLKFIGTDQRKYCAVCRKLREICDGLEIEAAIRGSVFQHALEQEIPDPELVAALNKAIGPTLARFTVPAPSDAHEPPDGADDFAGMPLDFSARSIRARRGPKAVRSTLLKAGGDRCAITGDCPRELLEVAYVVPFPEGDLHATGNVMLLRSDVHTLWDLNLIGVDPESTKIRVSERLKSTAYGELDGRPLAARGDRTRVSGAALRERWTTFGGVRDKERVGRKKTAKKAPVTAPAPDPGTGGPSRSRGPDAQPPPKTEAGIPAPAEAGERAAPSEGPAGDPTVADGAAEVVVKRPPKKKAKART